MSGIDPRGPRFTAAVTVVILAAALVSPNATVSAAIMAAQAACFAIGVFAGIQHTPTGIVFRRFVRPRLTPPAELEDPRPPRFAQAVGLVFATLSLIGYLTGALVLAQVAAGFAVFAALLNAVFGFCLGCEMYLLGLRLTRRPA
ncbi:DUF4395 domain-containing protein [Nocardioides sp. GY 10113]|uniref:DUF4395 domain-containing protein n=1 Tax=Nocardioides sp. GY 10113 TaxID=2569761 RepID=UPI0010A7D796|nr:DUF4395 domain-containing protein [Nocardioides sp. GY 10113]TIC88372.1 DUF4395 domain-containing protein [Nocardioides sp. GY 10113]